jgi:prepilin-type N-terminal cleavage/methylation domain-containing protein
VPDVLARLRRSEDERGLTLVEVLVAMLILAVVLMVATEFMIKATRQGSYIAQQSQAQQLNDTGMETATRLLRQAVYPVNGTSLNSSIITVATATKVQFTSRWSSTANASDTAFNTPVQQIVFQLNGTKLQYGTGAQNSCTAPAVCTYATPTANHTMVFGVQNAQGTATCPKNTGDGAAFHYWYVNPTGTLLPWSSATNTLSQISVVQIDLWTQTQAGGGPRPACVPLTNYVRLRNL